MNCKLRSRVFVTAGTLVLATSASMVSAAPANAAVSGTIGGTVYCATAFHGDNIVGIWIDAASGTDGWASRTLIANDGNNWSYTLSQPTSSYSIHLGCGDTPSSWYMTFYINGNTSNDTTWFCTEDDGCISG